VKIFHEKIFRLALKEAAKAAARNEVPIGAVLVKDQKVISKAHNATEKEGHFLAHAEIICIRKAAKKLGTKYLNGCELFITLEPCMMCISAAKLSRIESIHFLISSEKFGVNGKAYKNVSINAVASDLADDARKLLKDFFSKKR
jgi:tRNA(adenine34) deaminase